MKRCKGERESYTKGRPIRINTNTFIADTKIQNIPEYPRISCRHQETKDVILEYYNPQNFPLL